MLTLEGPLDRSLFISAVRATRMPTGSGSSRDALPFGHNALCLLTDEARIQQRSVERLGGMGPKIQMLDLVTAH